MTIVVDEVVIQIEVTDHEPQGGAPASAGQEGQSGREQIVAEAVERVLEILRAKEER